jgi:ribosome modulation factor
MSKRPKRPKSARKEGADAAQAGHARSANPYPASDTQKRDEWFSGYDAKATGTKPAKRPK